MLIYSMADIKLFSIQSDIESVQKSFADLGDNVKHRFLPHAINQIGRKAFTKSVRTAVGALGIPRSNLLYGSIGKKGESSKPMIKTKQAKSKNLSFEIKVKSRWLHVSESYFKPLQNKSGVKSTYYGKKNKHPKGGGRFFYKGAFLAKGKNSGKTLAYIPTGRFKMVQGKRKMIKRPILKALWAFNPAREFITKGIGDDMLTEFAPQIKDRYADKLNQYIAKQKPKMKTM